MDFLKSVEKKKIFSIDDILSATHANLIFEKSENVLFKEIYIDSRKIQPESLYIAIIGENNNGHDFVNQAVESGAKGIIIQEDELTRLPINKWKDLNCAIFAVKNTTDSLGYLAKYNRNKNKAKIVAITGTNGKTTVKEMSALLVSKHFNTLKTIGNFNNHIGLPLTMLNLEKFHEIAILELGMNHFGEIKYLANISKPDIGLITNIGPGHLEGVHSLDGVLKAKAELLDGLNNKSTLILNGDDIYLRKLEKISPCPVIYYGTGNDTLIKVQEISYTENSSLIKLILPDAKIDVRLNIAGSYAVSNALAAFTLAYVLNIKPDEIKKSLEQFTSVKGRMNIIKLPDEINIIDDTYNANPSSMIAAIETFQRLKNKNRGIIVLGDMYELGDEAFQLHKEIGCFASNSDIDQLYLTGNYADAYKEGVNQSKIKPKNIIIENKNELLKKLLLNIKSGDWILVKGSRAMAMETIVSGLKDSLI